jgi:V8-like Glu-specific endopeptidase
MRVRAATGAAIALAAILFPLAVTRVPSAHGVSASAIGRQSRASGVAIAGGNVYVWSSHRPEQSGGGCTLSFAVRSRRTHALGALIAGHCVRTIPGGPTYLVHQTQRLGRDGTEPGDLLGRVGRHASRLGKNGDSAFVRLVPNRAARPRVFVGPVYTNATIPVVGLMKVRVGLRICYSGAATGEHCGYRVAGGPETVVFKEGNRMLHIKHEWRATSSTCTSRRGDSGSPVYVRRNGKAYAVGLLSGGQQVAGKCPFFFTPLSVALHTLDLRLLTS